MTEQVADAPVPVSVHGEVRNAPVPLLPKDTVPVGVVAPVAEVSVTVTVQLVASPMTTLDGVQDTLVLVACRLPTVTVAVPELVA